ncbi:MAG: TolC family protein, partial [Burkholderiaceae bacterium]|nr:TolC family protein [Burkholderiaceae bacterium]
MKLRLIPALIMALTMPLAAQADGLAFGQARALMQERADVLKMSAADIENQRYQIKDADALNGPKITLNAKQVEGRKDINLAYGLDGVKSNVISGIVGHIPPILDGLKPTISGALQGVAQRIPNELKIAFEEDISGPRASVEMMWPLYTGGAISAKQTAARAGLRKAQAEHDGAIEKLDAQLAQKYFGVQLARSVEKLRSDMLTQQERDLHRAKRFEKAGMIAKIERMSAQVNRDTAHRELIGAQTDRKIAETELADLLREENVGALDTPMFVVKNLEPLIEWQTKALNHNPVLKAIEAQRDQALQGVRAAKSAYHPQVYLFGQYNFIKHYLTISEPDWVAGIGVNFTLWDNRDRSARVGSAQSLVNKVDAAQGTARHEIKKLVEIA